MTGPIGPRGSSVNYKQKDRQTGTDRKKIVYWICPKRVAEEGIVVFFSGMSPAVESAPESVEAPTAPPPPNAAAASSFVNTREYGRLDLRAIKVGQHLHFSPLQNSPFR